MEYTCETDGYFKISIPWNHGCNAIGYVNGLIIMKLASTNLNTVTPVSDQAMSCFIRKGSVIKIYTTGGGGVFIPLKE